jgi:uncharacterized protein YegJ (DUF2314 family)
MRRLVFSGIAWSILSLLALGCGGVSQPDTLIDGGYSQEEIDAATARAQAEVDEFIVELQRGDGEDFAVKAPIEDDGAVEHFWLTDVVYADGKFTGQIGNDPGMVDNVSFGQDWTIAKGDISDWMFMRDGKMHGNYTLRPLLVTLPEDQAEEFRAMFAEP